MFIKVLTTLKDETTGSQTTVLEFVLNNNGIVCDIRRELTTLFKVYVTKRIVHQVCRLQRQSVVTGPLLLEFIPMLNASLWGY